jgi:hypothetical protein
MLKKNKIVSAFLSNVNTNRSIDKYIDNNNEEEVKPEQTEEDEFSYNKFQTSSANSFNLNYFSLSVSSKLSI